MRQAFRIMRDIKEGVRPKTRKGQVFALVIGTALGFLALYYGLDPS